MKKLIILAFAGAAAFLALEQWRPAPDGPTVAPSAPIAEDALARAFERRQSDVQVEGEGVVVKLLRDDNDGSRHQRFIVELASGQTVLIAHNIDLAPRVAPLAEGDAVRFYGEYEWNNKGGVIHWTHHDPQGRHPGGWIRREGATFQ